LKRETTESVILGGITGVLVWLYDLRHLFLGGSPKSVVPDFLREHLIFNSRSVMDSACGWGRFGTNLTCTYLVTLFILTFAGAVSLATVLGLARFLKRKSERHEPPAPPHEHHHY